MARQVYWLSDAEWRRIEPLLPRGRKGAHRVDDRRVISGIVHMLKSGSPWRDCPEVYGPYTTVYNRWSRQGDLDGYFLRRHRIDRHVRISVGSFQRHQSPSLRGRRKRGPSTMRSAARAAGKPPKSTR